MPTLEEVKADATDLTGSNWDGILAKQADYLRAGRRYWQGLLAHTDPPSHTAIWDDRRKPDELDRKPPTVRETWREFDLIDPDKLFSDTLEIHEHEGPRGMGFTIYSIFIYDGVLWKQCRSYNLGDPAMEAANTRTWEAQTEQIT